jgi:tetratricopeptide (TPR) repeat protein
LRFYSRALEQDKSLVGCWIGQARMLIFLEEYPQAELWSRTGLGLFPSNAGLLASRAQAFCRMKQTRKAHELSDGSLRQDSRSAYAWLVRGEIMVANRQDLDTHCFDSAQQFDPDWLVPLEIALVYLHYHVPSKALLRARRAVEMAPDRYYAWYVQGLCQEQLGFDASARQSYQRCLELSPRATDAERRLLALDEQGWSPARFFRRLFSRFS